MPLLPLLLLPSTALADVAIEPPTGQIFTTHSLLIEGLLEHPDFVIVAFDGDPGSTISAHRAFGKGQASQHVLARGDATRGGYLARPSLHLLSKAAYDTWWAQTSATIEQQRTACAERGEGCVHISRFQPSFTAPTGTLPCGVSLELNTVSDAGGPDLIIDVYQVEKLDASTCKLDHKETQRLKDGQPLSSGGLCSAAGASAASFLAGLALLLGLGRRRLTS